MALTEKKRQLAAIMFTDIAGYTAMMGSDENKAIELLHNNRRLQKPLIEQHGGKWLKEMGDGVLASFDSAVNAVMCARDIQLQADNDLKNKIRIGIHLGDVTIEEEDVFGDGVNIASRLESIADPGGIYVSDAVYQAIRSHSEITYQYLGELQLKNVANKIGTYAIIGNGLAFPSRSKIQGLSKGSKNTFSRSAAFYVILVCILIGSWFIWSRYFSEQDQVRSLAVLPISDYTGDGSQAYFAAGVQDALIVELGQLGSLRVIGQQSTLQYKDSEKTIQEIASELNVDALIEASVQRDGERFRIQLKLITALPEEEQLWSQSFDTEMSSILDLYSQITRDIAKEIQLKLTPVQEAQLAQARPVNPQAIEAYMKGKFHMGFLTREGQMAAKDYFNKAIEIDPEYALSYAGLMGVWGFLKQMDFVSTEEANPNIEKYLAEALKRDNQSAEIYYWEGIKNIWTDYSFESGEASMKRCIELNPNHSLAWAYYSHLLMLLKRPEEMRMAMTRALEIDPSNLLIQALASVELMIASDYDSAIIEMKRLQSIMPNHPLLMMNLFICSIEKANDELATIEVRKMINQLADSSVVEIFDLALSSVGLKGALEAAADAWVERSSIIYAPAQQITMLYAYAGNADKTMEWLEQGYSRKDPDIPYIGVMTYLRPYHEEPRYIEIMEKMNLPLGEFEPSKVH